MHVILQVSEITQDHGFYTKDSGVAWDPEASGA